jgi:hypothetical protein
MQVSSQKVGECNAFSQVKQKALHFKGIRVGELGLWMKNQDQNLKALIKRGALSAFREIDGKKVFALGLRAEGPDPDDHAAIDLVRWELSCGT